MHEPTNVKAPGFLHGRDAKCIGWNIPVAFPKQLLNPMEPGRLRKYFGIGLLQLMITMILETLITFK